MIVPVIVHNNSYNTHQARVVLEAQDLWPYLHLSPHQVHLTNDQPCRPLVTTPWTLQTCGRASDRSRDRVT